MSTHSHAAFKLARMLRILTGCLCAIALTFGMGVSSCRPVKQTPSMEDGTELDSALRGFHKNLRWARYDEASQLVSESYRPSFMARYEELGEDLHITLLEVRDVKMEDGEEPGDLIYAIVDVEQEWYKEPNMTVKKERFVERWDSTPNGWRLTERLERGEWRDKEKLKKEEAKQKEALEKAKEEAAAKESES